MVSLRGPKNQEKVKNVHFYYLFFMVETENISLSSEKSVLYKKMSVPKPQSVCFVYYFFIYTVCMIAVIEYHLFQ